MKDEFFVKIWFPKETPDHVSEIRDIQCFNNLDDLLRFIHDNRYEIISVYKAECMIDWS